MRIFPRRCTCGGVASAVSHEFRNVGALSGSATTFCCSHCGLTFELGGLVGTAMAFVIGGVVFSAAVNVLGAMKVAKDAVVGLAVLGMALLMFWGGVREVRKRLLHPVQKAD